jgi:signal peptidase I
MRLPGYGEIKRNDIMVFNWPVGDSVIVHDAVIAHDYYGILRNEAFINRGNKEGKLITDNQGRLINCELSYKEYDKFIENDVRSTRENFINGGSIFISPGGFLESTGGIATLPIDKKENYIKRCVAVGGDTLEIINNVIHIDGVPEDVPPEALFYYKFYYKQGARIPDEQYLSDEYELYAGEQNRQIDYGNEVLKVKKLIKNTYTDTSGIEKDTSYFKFQPVSYRFQQLQCSQLTANKIASMFNPDTVIRHNQTIPYDYARQGQYCPYFPNDPNFNWTRDNFGPLYIPEKGGTIELNDSTWVIYKRAIEVYEQNEVKHLKNGTFIINGKEVTSYTFKQNYYWLMGDNRHGSADSRCWGFVPEDHVVGTASFVWFSRHPEKGMFDGGIRWDRVFSFVE